MFSLSWTISSLCTGSAAFYLETTWRMVLIFDLIKFAISLICNSFITKSFSPFVAFFAFCPMSPFLPFALCRLFYFLPFVAFLSFALCRLFCLLPFFAFFAFCPLSSFLLFALCPLFCLLPFVAVLPTIPGWHSPIPVFDTGMAGKKLKANFGYWKSQERAPKPPPQANFFLLFAITGGEHRGGPLN